MILKRTCVIAICCALSAIGFVTKADNKPPGGEKSVAIRKPNTRPNMPSRQRVTCVYEDGTLYLEFKYGEGEAVLSVTDLWHGGCTEHVFSTDAPALIYIGAVEAAAIEIYTESGNEYVAEIMDY